MLKLMQMEVREQEEDYIPGTEHPFCLIAIDCNLEAHLLQILNIDKCHNDYVFDELQEDMDGMGFYYKLAVGVYLVEVRYDHTQDYFGEWEDNLYFKEVIPYQECSKCEQPLRKDKDGNCMSCTEVSALKSGDLDGN